MAPKKFKTLQDIRRESIAAQKVKNLKLQKGSGIDLLHKKNEEFQHGKRVRDVDSDGEENEIEGRVLKAGRKKKAIPTKKKQPKKMRQIATTKPAAEIENWRPAGGENPFAPKHDGSVSSKLGIARISTWQLEKFTPALKALIQQYAELEALTTEELVHGGESVTDVFVDFENESVAGEVKGKIDGGIVEGRKLQVKFAQ